METKKNKQQTTPEQTGTEKKETPKTSKLKRERKYKDTPTQTAEERKATKEAERLEKKAKFYKDRSERANEIKDDLKQALILQQQQNEQFKNIRYTPERKQAVFDAVIDEIERGESVTNALIKYRIYSRTFFDWIDNDVTLLTRYARAHTKRADALFNKMVDIAVNMPDVNRARLVNDTIKYVCARISPEKYSEKQTINIIGNVNQNITTLSPEDRDKKILELMQKAGNIIDVTPE